MLSGMIYPMEWRGNGLQCMVVASLCRFPILVIWINCESSPISSYVDRLVPRWQCYLRRKKWVLGGGGQALSADSGNFPLVQGCILAIFSRQNACAMGL